MPNYDLLKKIINNQLTTILSVVVFTFVVIGNLVSTNTLSTQGISVSISEGEILKLEKENRQLSVKIEEVSNLKDIETVAKNLGYTRIDKMVFAPTSDTFALR